MPTIRTQRANQVKRPHEAAAQTTPRRSAEPATSNAWTPKAPGARKPAAVKPLNSDAAGRANLNAVLRKIDEDTSNVGPYQARRYVLPTVTSLHVRGDDLYINGRQVECISLMSEGAQTAQAAARMIAANPGKEVILKDSFMNTQFQVDEVSVKDGVSARLSTVLRKLENDAFTGRGPEKYTLPDVSNLTVFGADRSLPDLRVNGLEVGVLTADGADQAAVLSDILTSQRSPAKLVVEGSYQNNKFYIDRLRLE